MTKTSESDHEDRSLRALRIDAKSVEAVTDLDYGRYLVVTSSGSVYVLIVGPELSSLVRFSQCPTVGEWEAVPLRRDGETVPLLGIIELQLGRRAVFRIDVRGDGIETTRTTTPVSAMRRLAE
jgi:hypothetical protein